MTSAQTKSPMRILQVSSWQREGGAERVATNLHELFREAGHDARLVVGGFSGSDPERPIDAPGVVRMPNGQMRNAWSRLLIGARNRIHGTCPIAAGIANTLAEPLRAWDRLRGYEEYRFPGTRRLLELDDDRPHVVHCHNLHGGFFDLRQLPALSSELPVFLTLHDHWLLGGHCSYPFECKRWETGCGNCPHLETYPSLRRDGTERNWQTKSDIYSRSRVRVAAPCEWLLERAKRSMLAPAIVDAKVIPYGVDLQTFCPVPDRDRVRTELGLPLDAHVLLYAANRLSTNQFKDFQTIRNAVPMIASGQSEGRRKLVFVALGDSGEPQKIGDAECRFVPFVADPALVARYYQSADLFVHAAKADNFPNTILESLACGTPVVATDVGGIGEQIRDLDTDHATGALVPAGDSIEMARVVTLLLSDPARRAALAQAAREEAESRFDLHRQRDAYLDWFAQAVESDHRSKGVA